MGEDVRLKRASFFYGVEMPRPTKRTPEIVAKILERFGAGEALVHICNGKGDYPDQKRFWAWRQEDIELQIRYQDALLLNVEAQLEKSEQLMEAATTRDEILKADKTLNHYRWKSEKLLKAFKPELKSSVELSGAVGQFTIGWADDDEKPVEATENHVHQTPASRANMPLN